jgi:TetR/AcrR family transcriptional regulator, transcriptional repressor for nem operon
VRYPRDHKEKTRTKILSAAGKVFRRQGYHAAGVDMVMSEAGLTAGGFYSHFDSKEELLALAISHSGTHIRRRVAAALENLSGRQWLAAFLERYLSTSHCRDIEDGCPLAALASEVARADQSVKASFEAIVCQIERELNAHAKEFEATAGRDRALAALAMCVGGLCLARSVQDQSFAEQILASCRRQAMKTLSGESKAHTGGRTRRRRAES